MGNLEAMTAPRAGPQTDHDDDRQHMDDAISVPSKDFRCRTR
jgi:hypothetical protein